MISRINSILLIMVLLISFTGTASLSALALDEIPFEHDFFEAEISRWVRKGHTIWPAPGSGEGLLLPARDVNNSILERLSTSKFKDISSLTLIGSPTPSLTNAGLVHLKKFKNLRSLSLGNMEVNDEGLTLLGTIKTLEVLILANSKITDKGLKHLKNLRLKRLEIPGANIQGGGLVHLRSMPLVQLGLSRTPLEDSALEHIKHLPQLNSLFLENTPISNAGLQHLSKMQNLRNIRICDSRVSKTEAAAFKESFPDEFFIDMLQHSGCH